MFSLQSFSYRSKVHLRFHIAGPIKLELAACQSDRKEGFNSIFWNDSKKAMKNLSSSYYRWYYGYSFARVVKSALLMVKNKSISLQ